MTITELEQASDVPRSTIYYYVREGLIPPAQKAAASRALYADVHLELLQEIDRLKREGLPLEVIKAKLAPKIESGRHAEVDLVAQQSEKTRRTILETAARHFARKGYKRTRIADIIEEVGISPPAFYGHFHSKRQLLVESFRLFVEWSRGFLEPQLEKEPDLGVRLLRRVSTHLGVQAVSPDHFSLVRYEALQEGGEMREVAQGTYQDMTGGILKDLVRLREESENPPPVPDELVAYSLEGALEHVVMRTGWDLEYSNRDVLWVHLVIYLAVEALYTGRLDLSADLARYAELVNEMARKAPTIPPDAQS